MVLFRNNIRRILSGKYSVFKGLLPEAVTLPSVMDHKFCDHTGIMEALVLSCIMLMTEISKSSLTNTRNSDTLDKV